MNKRVRERGILCGKGLYFKLQKNVVSNERKRAQAKASRIEQKRKNEAALVYAEYERESTKSGKIESLP